MSTSSTTRLPLVCRLTRIRGALTAPSSPSVRQHCARCVECRQHFAQAEQWENGLRREAQAVASNAPATLESRILQAVNRSPQVERRPVRSFSWALAGVAAVAVAAVVVMQQRPSPRLEAPVQVATVEDVIAVANELPKQWRATVQPGTAKLLQDNLLHTEIASVSSDARSALDFLALNFLPARGDTVPAPEPMSVPRRSS